MKQRTFLFSVILLSFSFPAHAVIVKKAMVVSCVGKNEIFTPLKDGVLEPQKSLVFFNGKKHFSGPVRPGAMVYPGDILRTGNDGKLKVIYDSGDTLILGPATNFTTPSKMEKQTGPQSSELLYGKVRAIINKKGPYSGLKIVTPGTVVGIRGTDLFVSTSPGSSSTEVHVLRGEVQMAPLLPSAVASKDVVFVKTGNKGTISPEGAQVSPSTSADLKIIQATTTAPASELKDIPKEDQNKLKALMAKSHENIMEDIKATTPDVYDSLKGKDVTNDEVISEVMFQSLGNKAPDLVNKAPAEKGDSKVPVENSTKSNRPDIENFKNDDSGLYFHHEMIEEPKDKEPQEK